MLYVVYETWILLVAVHILRIVFDQVISNVMLTENVNDILKKKFNCFPAFLQK